MKDGEAKDGIDLWLEGELKKAYPELELPFGFEARFWAKTAARAGEPWFQKLIRDAASWFPVPTPSEVAAVSLIALLIGGSGGAASVLGKATDTRAQELSVRYLSGFPEFKGIPASSVAAGFLQAAEKESAV